MAAAQFCFDDSAMHYVLPVLWTTSRLLITVHIQRLSCSGHRPVTPAWAILTCLQLAAKRHLI